MLTIHDLAESLEDRLNKRLGSIIETEGDVIRYKGEIFKMAGMDSSGNRRLMSGNKIVGQISPDLSIELWERGEPEAEYISRKEKPNNIEKYISAIRDIRKDLGFEVDDELSEAAEYDPEAEERLGAEIGRLSQELGRGDEPAPPRLEKEPTPVRVGPTGETGEWAVECPECKRMSTPSNFPSVPASCEYCGKVFRKRKMPKYMPAKAPAKKTEEEYSIFLYRGEAFRASGTDEKGYRDLTNREFKTVGRVKLQNHEWKISWDDPNTGERKERILPFMLKGFSSSREYSSSDAQFPEEQINVIINQLEQKGLNPKKEIINPKIQQVEIWEHGWNPEEKGSFGSKGERGYELSWIDPETDTRTGKWYPLTHHNVKNIEQHYRTLGLGPKLKMMSDKETKYQKWKPDSSTPPVSKMGRMAPGPEGKRIPISPVEKGEGVGPVQKYLRRHEIAPKKITKITKTSGTPRELIPITRDQFAKIAANIGGDYTPEQKEDALKKKFRVVDDSGIRSG